MIRMIFQVVNDQIDDHQVVNDQDDHQLANDDDDDLPSYERSG